MTRKVSNFWDLIQRVTISCLLHPPGNIHYDSSYEKDDKFLYESEPNKDVDDDDGDEEDADDQDEEDAEDGEEEDEIDGYDEGKVVSLKALGEKKKLKQMESLLEDVFETISTMMKEKHGEICPPRIDHFCFITDNTYIKEEVLKMETQVIRCSQFQMFAPTTKTFVRRFLRAAQVSYKCPSLELEYLANYLAELSLMDYSFLTFLPSLIAASAVFLARWTLDQSYHPWVHIKSLSSFHDNPTLEHYSMYKASDLKATIVALQDLQLNTKGCPLSAIRIKYRQDKFKNVAAMSSPKLPETLF